jgi:hypothetical protein
LFKCNDRRATRVSCSIVGIGYGKEMNTCKPFGSRNSLCSMLTLGWVAAIQSVLHMFSLHERSGHGTCTHLAMDCKDRRELNHLHPFQKNLRLLDA